MSALQLAAFAWPANGKEHAWLTEPVKKRQGWPIYDLAEAASRLATPTEDQLMRYIKRMPANKLPVHLQKEFWDA